MTYKQFLAAFKKKAKGLKWRVTKDEEILANGTCPLGVLCVEEGDEDDYFERPWPDDAVDRLGLKRLLAHQIARAADHHYALTKEERAIRRDLLAACGLKERTRA